MNLRIKAIFYLKGNHCITEAVTYSPKDETITEESFEEEIINMVYDMRQALDDGAYSNSTKNFHFGDTAIKIAELCAYQIYIENVENENVLN